MIDPFLTILITGGTGSWGNAATQFLLDHTGATIRVFSRDERKQREMERRFGYNPRLRFLLGDVRNQDRLERAMQGVDVVFHAAALKEVPSGEYNISEVMMTNIIGTNNVANAAWRANVGKVVFLSTDKACMPINSYGISKAFAERVMVQANGEVPHGTEYCCVRYGNVHGSRGSVVELWAESLLHGVPLRVTDLTMTRFFLTVEAAVRVAWAAAHLAPRGGILVPHLPAYTLDDLCQAMRRVYGHGAADLETMGARVGEKYHEDLMTPEEGGRVAIYATDGTTPVYYCVMPLAPTWEIPPMTTWPVWDGRQVGQWYTGGLSTAYNSGTWPWRLTQADLEGMITDESDD